MTMPSNQRDPVADPAATYPTSNDLPGVEVAPQRGRGGDGPKATASALLAGVGSALGRLRRDVPRAVQELQERRTAGRCVLLAQLDGRDVAIGPFAGEAAAREVAQELAAAGSTRIVEVLRPAAFAEARPRAELPRPTASSPFAGR